MLPSFDQAPDENSATLLTRRIDVSLVLEDVYEHKNFLGINPSGLKLVNCPWKKIPCDQGTHDQWIMTPPLHQLRYHNNITPQACI